MLKYRINKNNILSDEDRITIKGNEILVTDIVDEYAFYTKNSVTCYTDNLNKINKNTSLIGYHNINTTFNNYGQNVYSFEGNYVVEEVNEALSTFSFRIDKYLELPLQMLNYYTMKSISTVTYEGNSVVIVDNVFIINDKKYVIDNGVVKYENDEYEIDSSNSFVIDDVKYTIKTNDKEYLYVYFNTPHFYDYELGYKYVKWKDDNVPIIDNKFTINGQDYFITDDKVLWINNKTVYDSKIKNNSFTINKVEYTIESNQLYIWAYINDKFVKMTNFELMTNSCIRFKWSYIEKNYNFITNLFTENKVLGDITGIRFFRENYFFTPYDNYTLYYNNPKCKLTIGLTNNFQTDLLKEYSLNEYVKDAKRKSINDIIDMEKDIYYPFFKNDKNYLPVMKIKFNLHFREHRGENWTVEPTANWNGTCVNKKGVISFIDGFFYNGVNKSNQSDLLTYLNFTDGDVRYQKNRLKKSFLRLSFYDSMNTGNQNLLAYSSIFMNSGEYFTKYIRYIEEEPYAVINANGDVIDELKGIRVNREPWGKTIGGNEEYRLSSQFVVTDKYNSTASSEGFYLYLWRDILDNADEDGLDIFMKVEFNHAGFGRVVPFMMPYWDKKKWKDTKSGIKSFEEILEDWNSTPPDRDKNEEHWKFNENNSGITIITDGQYGARQYDKFSYIHFKLKYDENEKKYIYYLDDNCYGNDNSVYDSTTATLTLNLYEAKMV